MHELPHFNLPTKRARPDQDYFGLTTCFSNIFAAMVPTNDLLLRGQTRSQTLYNCVDIIGKAKLLLSPIGWKEKLLKINSWIKGVQKRCQKC